MTREAEPSRRASAVVTDLDEARRKRTAPEAARDAKAGPDGEAGPSKPARRRRDPANRRFDAVKVERLKREIAEGRYEVDHWSVADRFIEHERNRG